MRYQYGFRLDAQRIHEEWLLVYKNAKPQQWFRRMLNPAARNDIYELGQNYLGEKSEPGAGNDIYEFGSHLSGQRKLWQKVTRSNSLFLSMAVQLNSEQLRPVFNWIVTNAQILEPGVGFNASFSINMLRDPGHGRFIRSFISSADTGIADINLVSRKSVQHQVQFDIAAEEASVKKTEIEGLVPQFRHETENGSFDLEFEDQSLGTQRLFCMLGPIRDILALGRV